MKDEETSEEVPPPSMSAHPCEHGSDGLPLPSPFTAPQDAPAEAHPPRRQRQLRLPHQMRLLVTMVVVLIVLAGGYGIFRVISPSPRQASSAFQVAHCPFPLGTGLVEGHDVRCGFLVVPEDRSHPGGRTIRLAVAISKTPHPRPAPDPVLVLGGGPGVPQLAGESRINASNLDGQTLGRDLIVFDQRGVGYSQPSLRCFDDETLRACHDRLVQAGIHLNAYTTLEMRPMCMTWCGRSGISR
jgi:alpha/beta hydrolase fold